MAKEAKCKTLDKRIIELMRENWLFPIYIHAGVVELLNKVNTMTDEELKKYMDNMIHPDVARAHIKEIYERLN
ncbi:MAG: hypothetical protein SNI70_11295 [Rikenellaceae bacterium]